MVIKYNLLEQIYFFNIGLYQKDDTFFQWNNKNNPRSNFFEIQMARNAPQDKIFYCEAKEDQKTVYYVEKNTVFCIGADPIVQSQLIEALLEHLMVHFFILYEDQLRRVGHGEISHFFKDFNMLVHDVFDNYDRLDLFETSMVNCKGCNSVLNVIIKKSIKFDKPTSTIVYLHKGHALLIYIDKQYMVRGAEIVLLNY